MVPKSHAGFTKVFVTFLTNYGHCVGPRKSAGSVDITQYCFTPYCVPCSSVDLAAGAHVVPQQQLVHSSHPPGTYYYIIHTQSDIPITSGEKTHILWKLGTCDFHLRHLLLFSICLKRRQKSSNNPQTSSNIIRHPVTSCDIL